MPSRPSAHGSGSPAGPPGHPLTSPGSVPPSPTWFDPGAHAALADLAGRLRGLAGDAAYQAGRDYLRKGLVKQGAVAGATAYATVTGSTDYRVSVAFSGGPDDLKVACTCPAHRRNKYCKHIVSVCVALLERPGDFTVSEAAPEVQMPAARRAAGGARGAAGKAAAPRPAELRAAGLETVDRLLEELADGGLLSLGPDKIALLAGAGELVRALKLRRLGNLLMALQRAAGQTGPGGQRGGQDGRGGQSLEAGAFARLLADLYATRRATGAHLDGRAQLDPQFAEDLLGKTWRDEDLEPVAGLELIEAAATRRDDGEFRVETSYLADLPTGTIYAERQITPSQLTALPKARHRHRLLVDEAGLYPGGAPRRIKLRRLRRAPLAVEDVDRLLARVPDSVAELRRALVERLATPFGVPDVPVAFRPAALLAQAQQVAAVDGEGRFLAIDWPDKWTDELPALLPPPGDYALFGLLSLGDAGLRLQCLAAISSALAWARGPIYPDGATAGA